MKRHFVYCPNCHYQVAGDLLPLIGLDCNCPNCGKVIVGDFVDIKPNDEGEKDLFRLLVDILLVVLMFSGLVVLTVIMFSGLKI